MENIQPVSENKNYTAISIGKLDELTAHSLIHPKLNSEIKGKVFVKETTKATGSEISFQIVPPHSDLGYFHTHKQNEETYIILKGSGEFQVDEDCFPITEGSIIRISPDGKRCLRNTSDTPMVYMVIQTKENSLEQWSTEDGKRVDNPPKWSK